MVPFVTRRLAKLPRSTPFVGPEEIERGLGRTFALRLGANESPFGASPFVTQAIAGAHMSYYGDPTASLLRKAIADYTGFAFENISVGVGIDGLLSLLCRAFLEPSDTVVTTRGSYPTFFFAAQATGATLETVAYRTDAPDLDGLIKAAHRHSAKLVYLANPDNPSGAFHGSEPLQRFVDSLPPNCILLLDEAYSDFVAISELLHTVPENVIRLRTFSKALGLAGLRIGYAVTATEIVDHLNKIRSHFEVGVVSQAAAIAALSDQAFLKTVLVENASGREALSAFATSIGLTPIPSNTNFVTIRVGSRERAELMVEEFAKQGVFIRKPNVAPLDDCIRITIGTTSQLELLSPIFETVVRKTA